MDTHKNASLTPRGREAMASSVIEGGLSKAGRGASVPYDAEDGRQVGRPFPGGGRGRFARSRIHRQAKRRQPNAPPSKACDGSATPASRSPQRSGFQAPPSAAS